MGEKDLQVGILALQGDVREHVQALRDLGREARLIKRPEHLEGLHGIILPGGESTTIGKLLVLYDLLEPLRERIRSGPLAAWGTCAGMILLAKDVGRKQPILGVMDVHVQRNAFGSQVDSFETDLPVACLGNGPFRAVFIRAPIITEAGAGVEVLARLPEGNRIVAAEESLMLATAFHPELTTDRRLHEHFLRLCSRVIV